MVLLGGLIGRNWVVRRVEIEMKPLKQQLRKFFIMGSQNCNRDPVQILEEAIEGGVTAFQFREKGEGSLSGEDKLELGKQLRSICRNHRIPFFINDDIDLVELLDVDGIHVGQGDMSVKEIRKQFPDKVIGLSISNDQELKQNPIDLIDYVGAGAVFSTTTKEDAKNAVGLEWIQTLRNKYPTLPIVGIGGINSDNAQAVLEAGADGVSVISAITQAKNIKKVVAEL